MPQCTCKGDLGPRKHEGASVDWRKLGRCPKYRCSKCKRYVHWCFGAADRHPSRCDDCWEPTP